MLFCHAAAFSNQCLSCSLQLPLFNKRISCPFVSFIRDQGVSSNIWMAAGLSEKSHRILLHKCNLKAHHLFIELLISKPCPKRRHFKTIPLSLSYADTHAKRRRLTKGGELHVLLTGHGQRRAHTSRRLLLLRPEASEPVRNTSPAADTPPTPDVKCEQLSLQRSRKVPTANASLVTNGGELIAW